MPKYYSTATALLIQRRVCRRINLGGRDFRYYDPARVYGAEEPISSAECTAKLW
ncbi:hypothetical protein KCP78_02695 [Salmonella enterica subsp. enterica]|nr:hypothetical protein KCP78_02695 [Salmonella enterica subsp. enterica]